MAINSAVSQKVLATTAHKPTIPDKTDVFNAPHTSRNVDEADYSPDLPPGPAFEHHYSVQQVSQMWGLGADAIRKLFEHQEGVLRISHPETLHKRRYTTLRIPESVLRRVHRRLTEIKGRPV